MRQSMFSSTRQAVLSDSFPELRIKIPSETQNLRRFQVIVIFAISVVEQHE